APPDNQGTFFCVKTEEHYAIPAKVEFQRVVPFANLMHDSTVVEATYMTTTDGTSGYAYDIALLPGDYDVYVTPSAPAGCSATPPPPILTHMSLQPDVAVPDVELARPTLLQGTIAVPDPTSLEGWRFDLLDPEQGRPISTTRLLSKAQFDSVANKLVVSL